jgi:hypothetical protein
MEILRHRFRQLGMEVEWLEISVVTWNMERIRQENESDWLVFHLLGGMILS